MIAYFLSILSAFFDKFRVALSVQYLLACVILQSLAVVLSHDVAWHLPTVGLNAISIFLTALCGLLIYLRPKMKEVIKILVPLSFLFLLLSVMMPNSSAVSLSSSWWIYLHVSLILLGFGCFALSFSLSSLYLLVNRRLKRKQLQGIHRYPALEILDRYNSQSMMVGFLALTTGLSSGFFWALQQDSKLELELTVISSLLVWCWYALGMYTRLRLGRRMRWAAWFGVIGFAGVVLLIFISAIFIGKWHFDGAGP